MFRKREKVEKYKSKRLKKTRVKLCLPGTDCPKLISAAVINGSAAKAVMQRDAEDKGSDGIQFQVTVRSFRTVKTETESIAFAARAERK